jgi:hypothetical protein
MTPVNTVLSDTATASCASSSAARFHAPRLARAVIKEAFNATARVFRVDTAWLLNSGVPTSLAELFRERV